MTFPLHFRGCPSGPSSPIPGRCTCDSVKLGDKPPIVTRGTPIEKLPPIDSIIVEKVNEMIDRINQMNEVPNGR